MYDLCVDGVMAWYQRRPSSKRLVRREPLVGVVNGTNTIFLTSHRPFLYESLAIYTADAPFVPATVYSADADGGVIRLSYAPDVQAVADYTAVPLSTRQVIYFAWAGFDLMQALWPRDLRLSNDETQYLAASPDDTHIYICSASGDGLPTDPVTGSLTLATSARQRAFLARCIEYAFLEAASVDAALADVAIRERFGGIAVDPTRRTRNILDAKKDLWEDLLRALLSAQDEVYPDGEQYVADVNVQHTEFYEKVFQWQYGDNLFVARGNR